MITLEPITSRSASCTDMHVSTGSVPATGSKAEVTEPIAPLTSPSSVGVKWKPDSIVGNQQLEANLARVAIESPAAHKTADALLATLSKLFTLMERSELKATTTMLAHYAGDKPDFRSIGQLGAGGFTRIMAEATRGERFTAHDEQEPLTLREKATAFYALTNSNYFSQTMQKIHGCADTQKQVAGLVDLAYLASKQFGPPFGSSAERPLPDQLIVYTFNNENKNDVSENAHLYERITNIDGKTIRTNPARPGGSLTQSSNEFRERTPHATQSWATAADLLADQRLTTRELAFAHLNPRNRLDRDPGQFGEHGPVRAFQSLALDRTVVERDSGALAWTVKQDSGFAQDARLQHKPVVAGPSGTTDRFMTAARLIGPGLQHALGLDQPKLGESTAQTQARAEREMKELVRWMAVGYLVDDSHHSMIEVNVGAANHGLPAQWGTALYCEPFAAPIHTRAFSISSATVMNALQGQPDVSTDASFYRYDLQGGGRARFSPDGRIT